MSDLTNEDESIIYECPAKISESATIDLLTKNHVKCADYHARCRGLVERLQRDLVEERQGAAEYLEGSLAEHNQTITRLQAELAKSMKGYSDLLRRVKFDESTPPGEQWHIMAILGELMQENKMLREQLHLEEDRGEQKIVGAVRRYLDNLVGKEKG